MVSREKLCKKNTFEQKYLLINVDEIGTFSPWTSFDEKGIGQRFDPRSWLCNQFHQHFMSSFCANIILPKKSQSQTINKENCRKTLSYKKATRKMLVKLTPGVNLISILLEAFICADPKSAKRQSSCQCLFALWGFSSVIATRKMLVKLTPGLSDTGRSVEARVVSDGWTLTTFAKWRWAVIARGGSGFRILWAGTLKLAKFEFIKLKSNYCSFELLIFFFTISLMRWFWTPGLSTGHHGPVRKSQWTISLSNTFHLWPLWTS